MPAREPGRPLVIAHRGASRDFPENTVEAFRGAAALGADFVELDVRRTGDGVLAVHHDAALADGRLIVETVAADLPASVALLDEAFDACAGMGVNIEIKNEPVEADFDESGDLAVAVAAAVMARGAGERVIVSCFHLPTLDRVTVAEPVLRTAWLVNALGDLTPTLARLLDHGHRILHPRHTAVSEEAVRTCHQVGVSVNVWTCDDPGRIAVLASWGVDGICTNVPDVARAVIDGRHR